MTGKLLVIPTPIGNLKDITVRALEALQSVELLLCEDTRHTLVLLRHYEIQVPLLSYHKFNERERSASVIEKIAQGACIGLVSDAGMPGISDPGEILIKDVIEAGYEVEVLPGPSAAITGLVGSGLIEMPFTFFGFLSRDNRARKKQWELIREANGTLVFYESPKRVRKTIALLKEELGNRTVCIARELTKIHEEYLRSDLATLASDPELIKEKGEIVVIIGPKTKEEAVSAEKELRKALLTMSLSAAVKDVAKRLSIPRNELYELGLSLTGKEDRDGS